MAQFSGAGAGEHKAQFRPLLHQAVHHIQKLRCLLDLIHHHGGGVGFRSDPLPQAFGPGLIRPQHVWCQQIDPQRLGKLLQQPGGFAGAARAEQKEAAGRRLQKSPYNRHFGCGNGVSVVILHPFDGLGLALSRERWMQNGHRA